MKDTPKTTAALIRAAYPHAGTTTKASYCVLGAVSRWNRPLHYVDFPHPSAGAEDLAEINPSLHPMKAWYLSATITMHNDCGEIDRAWEVLDEALESGSGVS